MANDFSMKSYLNRMDLGEGVRPLTGDELLKLQEVMLEIYGDVFDACERNGLRLFLQGGTLLGKVRHGGLIPWDDDMDLGMMRPHYNKLIRIFDSELREKYILRAPGYHEGTVTRFINIYKKDSYLDKVDMPKRAPRKVGIDIFPIDFCPDGKLLRTIKGVECNGIVFLSSSRDFREFCTPEIREGLLKTPKGTVNYFLRQAAAGLSRPLPIDSLFNLADKAARGRGRTDFCTSAMGRWHYLGEMQKTSTFLPLKRSEFCGKRAWTLHDEDAYLRHNYGPDYMEIPPKSKQEMHFIKKISL